MATDDPRTQALAICLGLLIVIPITIALCVGQMQLWRAGTPPERPDKADRAAFLRWCMGYSPFWKPALYVGLGLFGCAAIGAVTAFVL
jgi:hypothetical protein